MDLLGAWTFVSSSRWSWPEKESLTNHKNYISYKDVPALVSIKEQFEADGYKFDYKPVQVMRYESAKNGTEAVSYKVLSFAHFIKGDGKLTVAIEGNGYPTVEDAVMNSVAKTRRISYYGEPVEGGKGQLKRCRKIALRLLSEHGNHLDLNNTVQIPYCTRGGRGGWKEKIAQRRFSVSELQALAA